MFPFFLRSDTTTTLVHTWRYKRGTEFSRTWTLLGWVDGCFYKGQECHRWYIYWEREAEHQSSIIAKRSIDLFDPWDAPFPYSLYDPILPRASFPLVYQQERLLYSPYAYRWNDVDKSYGQSSLSTLSAGGPFMSRCTVSICGRNRAGRIFYLKQFEQFASDIIDSSFAFFPRWPSFIRLCIGA